MMTNDDLIKEMLANVCRLLQWSHPDQRVEVTLSPTQFQLFTGAGHRIITSGPLQVANFTSVNLPSGDEPTKTPTIPEPIVEQELLTVAKLEVMHPGQVIASGIVSNSSEGIYMTDYRPGDNLLWVAVRGKGVPDWTIYMGWAEEGLPEIIIGGQKVTKPSNILKLVPATEEAFKLYRP